MRRRILGLLCALALCLGLLPVTALAVAPNGQVIYVGNENVTNGGYWTTDSAGTVTAFTGEGTPADNFIYYDASRNTLTLHNATIRMSVSIDTNTLLAGAAIGVLNQYGDGNAELTITLEGTNTIAEVGKGIFVLANSASTGSSNLTIQGDGSLNASASQTGIWVQSNSKNAALCVENAEVTASSGVAFKNGVFVQAEDGSDVSLTVNGGSLTASDNANIWFQFGTGVSGSGKPTVTVSNNAIVRANGGIANNSSTSIQYGTGNEENGGIVFDGSIGTVYGSVTLQDDLTIGAGETLTVPSGSSLNCNGKLTNNGTILASGGTVTGSLSGGSTVTTPNITAQPTGQTVTEGTQAAFSVSATAGSETPTYQWQQSTDNGGSWTDISGATEASYTTGTTTTSMSGYQYRCVVKSASGVGVISSAATLTVTKKSVTGVTLSQTELTLYTGGTATLTATVEPSDATDKTVTWSSSDKAVATVDGSGNVTAVSPGTATITATTTDGSKTATCTVTVRRYVPPAPSKTPSEQALDKIGAADDGDTVTVSLPAGNTVLDAEVFEALAGRDVTLVVKLPGGAAWTVDGKDVPEGADFTDIDMGVTMGADAIPADVVNAVTGEAGAVQLALAHDGPFGFEMTLTAPVGTEGAGLWANLYRFDEAAGRLVFQASARVGEDGTAALPFDHASQWAIVLDTVSHELPFSDVSPADWFANPVGVAYRAGLMTGYAGGSGLFGPNDELTRAQAATVLCRALGTDAEAPACGMADVDPGAWYAGPVDWAVSSGIMMGYGDGSGRFGVDDALTREQLAVVLWRAAGSPDAGAYDGSAFSDGGDASGWAEPALAWAVKTGVLGGSDDGSGGTELRPTASITRAEAATMLARRLVTK